MAGARSDLPGGEVGELREKLARCIASLDYPLLNDRIMPPIDESLAQWVRPQLALPGVEQIGVQSTLHEGVDLDQEQHGQPKDKAIERREIRSPTSGAIDDQQLILEPKEFFGERVQTPPDAEVSPR